MPIENKLEDFSTILIDSPGQLGEYENEVVGKVKSANVILVVYDMTDEQTVDSLRSYWLPFIQKWNPKVALTHLGVRYHSRKQTRPNPS